MERSSLKTSTINTVIRRVIPVPGRIQKLRLAFDLLITTAAIDQQNLTEISQLFSYPTHINTQRERERERERERSPKIVHCRPLSSRPLQVGDQAGAFRVAHECVTFRSQQVKARNALAVAHLPYDSYTAVIYAFTA